MISNFINLFSQQQYVRDTGLGWTFGMLGLLGLVAVPIVILIYLIKSKYVPKTVSSTFIWRRSLKYMKRRIPINFIMSLLLIVQLLSVVAATAALMDVRIEEERGQDKIIIIDASASMTLEREAQITTSTGTKKWVKGTRYDYALNVVEELTAEVDEMSGVCLIFAGDYPQILTESQPEKDNKNERTVPYIYTQSEMENKLEILRKKTCSDKATDLNKALALAAEAIDTSPEAQIYLITDKERSSFTLGEEDSIEIIACNDVEKDRNLGITGFEEIKSDKGFSFEVSIDAQGRNQSYIVDIIFELDGVEMDRKKESLSTISGSSSPRTKTVTFGPVRVDNYERARILLEVEGDIVDYDNEACLYFVPEKDINILYVSNLLSYKEGTTKLDYDKKTILLNSLSSTYSIPQESIFHGDNVKKAPTSGYDLYIYEGVVPENMPTDGAVWYINAPAGVLPGIDSEIFYVTTGALDDVGHNIDESVYIGDYAKEILNNVDYKPDSWIPPTVDKFSLINANTDEYGRIPGFDVIFTAAYEKTDESGNKTEELAPIMLAGTVGTTRVLVSTFELSFVNTTMPFDVTNFTLLKRNLLGFSSPDILPNRSPFIGEKLEFNPPSGIESIKYMYFTPEEEAQRYTGTKGEGSREYQWSKADGDILPSLTLKKFGLYEMQVTYEPTYIFDDNGNIIETASKTETFSVYTRAVDSEINLNTDTLQELIVPAQGQTEATPFVRYSSILPWIVLVLIVLLIIEWGVYYRDEY